jgi:hypothetical protein
MNRTKRIELVGWLVLSMVAVTAFAVLLVVGAMAGDDPLTSDRLLEAVVTGAALAVPWVFALRVLWRTWWRRTGRRLLGMDGPARLLAVAAATLPEDRRDWGVAMASELAHVQGGRSRWQFAAGSAQVAILPPGRQVAVFVAGGLAVVATAASWLATGYALPPMRVFALTFVAFVGALATLMVARSRRVRDAGPGPAIAVTAFAGVGGCIAMIAYYLMAFPSAARALTPATAVGFGIVLAGCVWLALIPPRTLIASGQAQAIAVGIAIVLSVGLVIMSRLGLRGAYGMDAGLMLWLTQGPMVVAVGSAAAAAVGRSLRVGTQACAWGTVLGMLLIIVAWLAEAPLWDQQGAGLLLDADPGAVGVNLGDALWWTPISLGLFAVPLGVIGATLGSARERRRRARTKSDPIPV